MEIVRQDPRQPEVARLLQQHFEELHRITPKGSAHSLPASGLEDESITLWAAWENGVLLGCAALKELDLSSGEVKSMRTVSSRLRSGVGRQLLQQVRSVARQRGYRLLLLETGSFDAFEAARRFYENAGFRYRGPFDGYSEDPNSVFMELPLDQ